MPVRSPTRCCACSPHQIPGQFFLPRLAQSQASNIRGFIERQTFKTLGSCIRTCVGNVYRCGVKRTTGESQAALLSVSDLNSKQQQTCRGKKELLCKNYLMEIAIRCCG